MVRIERLTSANFGPDSLDGFIRHQEVRECWRSVAGQWRLEPIAFTEHWDAARLRAEAAELLRVSGEGLPVLCALDEGTVVGYASFGERLGSRKQYMELVSYHVTGPRRGEGIGRLLFDAACAAARAEGAEKLYISSHSSRESQAAYKALGCTLAQEIDAARAAAEPCDVQMEYDLCRPLTFRFGGMRDLPAWMRLVRRVAWNFPGLETEAAHSEHEATVAKFIGRGSAICAVEGERLIGVLLFSRRRNQLCCMVVAPEHRRRGAAQGMFDLMLTIADPGREMTVTTFREGDPMGDAPRAFYFRQGFRPGPLVVENDHPCQIFIREAQDAQG